MASRRNDMLLERTVEGSVNYYDRHHGKGTATEKGLATRLGGHKWNIINNQDRHEIYFRGLRSDEHYLDKKGRHTIHMFDSRRRKFPQDERQMIKDCVKMPEEHPRANSLEQRRTELQLAQVENYQSYGDFQNRCRDLIPQNENKRFSIHNKRYANEVEKLVPRIVSTKDAWMSRRGEPHVRSASCPNLEHARPRSSLAGAIRDDARKEVSQKQCESANFAPWNSAHTYANSIESTAAGRQHSSAQQYCSVHRLENHDFAVSRKNNHFSSQDKLTRADPFYMRPRLANTNNSVKYDILSNERRWFKY